MTAGKTFYFVLLIDHEDVGKKLDLLVWEFAGSRSKVLSLETGLGTEHLGYIEGAGVQWL